MSDRLKLAKKRRAAQLKAYAQYEKQLNKNASRRGKKTVTTGCAVPACGSSSSSRARSQLRFSDSVLLLDATVRNDVDEGSSSCLNLYTSCTIIRILELVLCHVYLTLDRLRMLSLVLLCSRKHCPYKYRCVISMAEHWSCSKTQLARSNVLLFAAKRSHSLLGVTFLISQCKVATVYR